VARPKRSETIVNQMESLAITMLEKAKLEDTNIDLKMDIFSAIREWVKVKAKLEDDDGGAIAEYKRRLAGEDTEPKKRRAYGGARLEAIRSSLPSTGDSDSDSDSHAIVSEDIAPS